MFRKKPQQRNVRVHLKGQEHSYDGILTHIVRIDGIPHYVIEAPVMFTPVQVDGQFQIQRHDLQNTALFQCADVMLLEVYP